MKTKQIFLEAAFFASLIVPAFGQFKLNNLQYFEERGSNILVYSNTYSGGFCDEKQAGIEIIQRGERIATGGGIRLVNTPEQWDVYGDMTSRKVNTEDGSISVELTYTDFAFTSEIRVTPKDKGVLLQVYLKQPVPEKLVGKAGMNLEFFPASYFGKNFLVDGSARILPKYPQHDTVVKPVSEKAPQYFGESTFDDRGRGEFLVPLPLATGKNIVLAPEDEALRCSIKSEDPIGIYDGRHLAQNGMFVIRALLPANKTGKVLEWYIEPTGSETWIRKPNIGFSQIGYIPSQKKVSVIELDKNDKMLGTADIIRINPDGTKTVAKKAQVKAWGEFYHRYQYATVDFSDVKTPGLYAIRYGNVETNAFPIDKGVFSDKWHASMDISLVVNMDHMEVNEAYRVWHGRANMDDALQAPTNISIHDGYTMGDSTNTKYKPLEHIPGLAVGGWYDAGDFDIQYNTVVSTVMDLSSMWRLFKPMWDQTFIDEKTKFADIHRPDGVPDAVQQIMHGTLNINAQVENIGFVASVIGQPDMHHYHHLGDAMTLTDGLIYDPSLALYEVKGNRSGTPDDRIVVTRSSFGSGLSAIVALASASSALKEYFPEEAERSLKNAVKLWERAQKQPQTPQPQNSGRDFSGLGDTKLNAAFELWQATGEQKYRDYFMPLLQQKIDTFSESAEKIASEFGFGTSGTIALMTRAYDFLDKESQQKIEKALPAFMAAMEQKSKDNPYQVSIIGSGWAGNNQIISNSLIYFQIWRHFPKLVNPELIFKGMNYLFGCHPYSNVSFVTAVGVNTKKVAYGNNRADYTVVPGGIVPGLMVKNPDFLENKDDYPFLWGENECCINTVPNYVMLNLACEEIAKTLEK